MAILCYLTLLRNRTQNLVSAHLFTVKRSGFQEDLNPEPLWSEGHCSATWAATAGMRCHFFNFTTRKLFLCLLQPRFLSMHSMSSETSRCKWLNCCKLFLWTLLLLLLSLSLCLSLSHSHTSSSCFPSSYLSHFLIPSTTHTHSLTYS